MSVYSTAYVNIRVDITCYLLHDGLDVVSSA
jgi:hypothetical protein